MRKRYFLLILIIFGFSYINVDASSIEYNLTIDDELQFHEKIVYKVNENELDTSGNYDYLTSVVNDTIYFDNDESVPYTKTKQFNNNQYVVTLEKDYHKAFFGGQRIIRECFSEIDLTSNAKEISVSTGGMFYCHKRADDIVINVKIGSLNVSSSNADFNKDGVYTWKVDDETFNIKFSAQIPESSKDVNPAYGTGFFEEEDDEIQKDDAINNDELENTDDNDQEKTISIGTFIVIGIVISIISVIAIIILKAKKNNLDQI